MHPADVPEPVGSPAVLSQNRVSNLPLRVVRSLFITIKEGFVMDRAKAGLTVYFEEPFWVGVFERVEDGKLSVCKVTFGSEPRDYEVWDFVLRKYYSLKFSPDVEVAVKDGRMNPKRMQREERKTERRRIVREKKEADKQRMFDLKQQKRKDKHRGR